MMDMVTIGFTVYDDTVMRGLQCCGAYLVTVVLATMPPFNEVQ